MCCNSLCNMSNKQSLVMSLAVTLCDISPCSNTCHWLKATKGVWTLPGHIPTRGTQKPRTEIQEKQSWNPEDIGRDEMPCHSCTWLDNFHTTKVHTVRKIQFWICVPLWFLLNFEAKALGMLSHAPKEAADLFWQRYKQWPSPGPAPVRKFQPAGGL